MQEAAELLGTTVDGVRSRIKRGTLDSAKVGGAVYVLLDPDRSPPSPDQPGPGGTSPDQSPDRDAVLAAKDETIAHLRRELDARNEELRRKDAILLTLAQRVPELEPPQGCQEGAEEPPNGVVGAEAHREPERRSWWRRVFDF
ncbi:MAG: hypothetical protein M3R38_23925 [Actinomycetota bacterium]|nr:hypothetical protein [Actinomycetota bacterium]